MRISHKHKFIFFSNPKTGSSSLRQFLDPYSDFFPVKNYHYRTADNLFYPHITPQETRELFALYSWDFQSYRKFVFVRNPWARLVSLYEHIGRSNQPGPFNQWLRTVQSSGMGGGGENWQRWRRYGAWSIENFISDPDGSILVDQVIRIEDVKTRLLPYLAELGLPVIDSAFPEVKNRGSYGRHYSEYYDDETVNYVADRYRYDIDNYHYVFEHAPSDGQRVATFD